MSRMSMVTPEGLQLQRGPRHRLRITLKVFWVWPLLHVLSSRRSPIPTRPPPTRAAKATNSSLQPASGLVVLRPAGAAPGSAAAPFAAPCPCSRASKVDRGRGIPLSGMPFGPSNRRRHHHVAVASVVDHIGASSHRLLKRICYVMLC